MQSNPRRIVLLGTGGTIAGTSAEPGDNVGYSAAQLGARQLVAAIPALAGVAIEVEQVAQLDSKDMGHAVWRLLAERIEAQLGRADVDGIVVTHGTDTMEETAYFLQRVLAPAKPVVLVGAMRPATALLADGPQNLLDAVRVAQTPGTSGVVVVFAGEVHSALDVRKTHTYRLAAFDSGDAGTLAQIEEGRLRRHRAWPGGIGVGLDAIAKDAAAWPWVEIVTSHAGAGAHAVRALQAAGVQGIVVAATGNGTVHLTLLAALVEAQAAGVAVLRSSRCLNGAVIEAAASVLPSAGALTPVQARIELMLRLLQQLTMPTAEGA